jgi:feruloyl-CoA synthase
MMQICKDSAAHGDIRSLMRSSAVVAHIKSRLSAHNARQRGSSTAIGRVLLMVEPPSIDANEITDKGYLNQRAVLEHRRDMVARLYANQASPDVIVIA